ncbi:MAG: ZPR1 zinc finger domain-containing protein [Candidatus Aenigmarchaeota archaeon]|nr:ZPR1 zinc finger domain-containing protein [Candidatus Aenigmarchaeota archaeon]
MTMMTCPVCGKKTLRTILEEKELPYFGKCLIVTSICDNCGYKFNDVFTIEVKEPKGYWLKVQEEEDLFAKIIRGSNGTIEIKEIGVKIEPGPNSRSFIKNVEGMLNEIEDVLKGQLKVLSGKRKLNVEKLLKKIKKMKDAEIKFTISIKDPTGVSKIIHESKPERVFSRRLRKNEIKNLKTSVFIFDKK